MGGISELLSYVDQKKRVIGRNLSDLVDNPQAVMSQWSDQLRQELPEMIQDPSNYVGGGVGHIAYHGSPHKFDKFSLDKIGTGEGAQAYGHGLYFAESPKIAQDYKYKLSQGRAPLEITLDGAPFPEPKISFANPDPAQQQLARIKGLLLQEGGDVDRAIARTYGDDIAELEKYRGRVAVGQPGQLYKTDIPDEAVARFLDWDKPLSQQSEVVQSIIARQHGVSLDNYRKMMKLAPDKFDKTGKEMVSSYRGAQPDEVTSDLFANGIQGIRYLDGVSRSSGQGSSNFVVFDPELIRILERNGVPTGQTPWKAGEWLKLRDLIAE